MCWEGRGTCVGRVGAHVLGGWGHMCWEGGGTCVDRVPIIVGI